MRVKNNLLTLGSAAVIAVYAAGYARTSEAAHRFDEADGAERRRPAPEPNIGVIGDVTPVADTTSRAASSAPVAVARASAKTDTAVAAVAAVAASSVTATEPPRAPDSTTAKSSTAPVTSVPDSASRVAQSAADSAAQAQRERGPFKDGTFYGWGTSRHGDIQAGVEIRNGKIYDAWVEQCLTRYSCSWISALPGQVVTRQSPEVDFVSGATQSTNAFYYGVAQAIARAK